MIGGERLFTIEELKNYDGVNPNEPVYLAVKGVVFDVTKQRDMYEPGKGYSVFAGKDASKALGKSSLKLEDCIADYSGLNEEEMKTLDKWLDFYKKKYPVIGRLKK
jgi:membrane-associated progesterone receptor component